MGPHGTPQWDVKTSTPAHLSSMPHAVRRACVTADQIAREAEFFSFGTNDLTQMGCGFSRDDAGKFLGEYVEKGIFPCDPFQSIDTEGVGEMLRWAMLCSEGLAIWMWVMA